MTVKTHTGSSLHFIACIPEPSIEQELHAFKLELLEKYQCKAALKSPAHITLIPPFPWPNFQDEKIIEHFKVFQSNISPFEVIIDGFCTFRTQVFYAKPVDQPILFKLQSEIRDYFEPILKDKLKNKFQFHPHITLANRDLKAGDLPQIIQEFSEKNYKVSIPMKSVSLLKHNGSKWDVISETKL